MTVTVNVLYFPGTNCERETLSAFARVGADPRLVFASEAARGNQRIDDADVLCIPGGFTFGDHLGAGGVAGALLRTKLADQLKACADRPVIAICNGFQIATRAGMFGDDVALAVNAGGTFRHRMDQPHVVQSANSPWLAGLAGQTLRFPCAHGEGRFVHQGAGPWAVALRYPPGENPDGSTDDIAGVVSANGLVFGLMDHPERAVDGPGNLEIFRNGVAAARA
ncbi:MAG: phosphoribosylformylglycinamidine synthase subunit PurQ [Acidimicrobiia bacterium]